MASTGEIGALVEALIVAHYDPAYRRAGDARAAAAAVRIDALDDPALSAAADQIAARLSAG
jgi:tRNA 2-selenouridine synthase